MRHPTFLLATASTLAALTSCASGTPVHQSDAQRAASYVPYEGPPISQFTWLGRFYSWEPLGRDQLVVFTTPTDAFYLKVWPNCDLRFVLNRNGSEGIAVTSTSGAVSAGLDSIIENSPDTGHMRCPISEIRKIDYGRMRADQRARVQAQANPETPAHSAPK